MLLPHLLGFLGSNGSVEKGRGSGKGQTATVCENCSNSGTTINEGAVWSAGVRSVGFCVMRFRFVHSYPEMPKEDYFIIQKKKEKKENTDTDIERNHSLLIIWQHWGSEMQ